MYQCNTIKTHIDEWSFRAALVIVSTLLILPLKLSPHDFTDNDTLEREREDRLKFVISLKPTLSLVYFPKPSGFQIEGVWRRFWPGTTVHGYSWTGALAVWRRGSPGHTPSRMRRSLDPIQPAPSRQDRPAGRQHTHTRSHICLVLLMNMHKQELRLWQRLIYGQQNAHACSSLLSCLETFHSHVRGLSTQKSKSCHLSSFTRPHVVARCAKHLYSRANHSFVQRWAVTSYIYLSTFLG